MNSMDVEIDRPNGHLDPPSRELSQVRTAIDEDRFEEALAAIEEFEPSTLSQHAWTDYLKGLSYVGLEHFESGYNAFEGPYMNTTGAVRNGEASARFRIAAKCLNKMGWFHRRHQNFERAYALHSIQFQYLDHHGSFQEMHDATISLDVDAYFLKNANLSEMWLQRSLPIAESISDPVARSRALGLSWNNLAGTFCQLRNFERAEEAIEASLEHWADFEDEAGTEEFRTVWANVGVGDVYQRWGSHLEEIGEEGAKERYEKAVQFLRTAVELAGEQGMDASERESIESKLDRLREKSNVDVEE